MQDSGASGQNTENVPKFPKKVPGILEKYMQWKRLINGQNEYQGSQDTPLSHTTANPQLTSEVWLRNPTVCLQPDKLESKHLRASLESVND